MKKFNIKFDDFCCSECSERLFVPDIYKSLKEQYEPNTDANGYLSILITEKCDCGNKYKIYCECHEYANEITVCVRKMIKLSRCKVEKL